MRNNRYPPMGEVNSMGTNANSFKDGTNGLHRFKNFVSRSMRENLSYRTRSSGLYHLNLLHENSRG